MIRRRSMIAAVGAFALGVPLAARAADLAGKWTTEGRYVLSFERSGSAWLGTVVEAATGREFDNTTLTIAGAREHTGERAYGAEMKRVP